MAEISAAQVKRLRDKTGAGMMECKKALVEAQGELDRAIDLLRERGLAKARGKAGRATSDGSIVASVSDDGRSAVLIELNCETDFVARTPQFQAFAECVAKVAREKGIGDVDALLAAPLGDGSSVKDLLVDIVAKLGENMQIRRVEHLEAGPDGRIAAYIHAGGKIGSLIHVTAEDPARAAVQSFAHNVCMHVAATSPMSVSIEDLPTHEVARERAVLSKQAEAEGKPPNVVAKMIEGRLQKFFKEVVLLEQPLVMDPDRTVGAIAKDAGVRVVGMRRFQLGEELAE